MLIAIIIIIMINITIVMALQGLGTTRTWPPQGPKPYRAADRTKAQTQQGRTPLSRAWQRFLDFGLCAPVGYEPLWRLRPCEGLASVCAGSCEDIIIINNIIIVITIFVIINIIIIIINMFITIIFIAINITTIITITIIIIFITINNIITIIITIIMITLVVIMMVKMMVMAMLVIVVIMLRRHCFLF